MSFERNLIYYNALKDLQWDTNGFLIYPNPDKNHPGNAWDARNFRDILLSLIGTGNIKVYGSIQKLPPDFSLPSAFNNLYVPIVLADYALPNVYYPGATGVTVSGSSAIVELNTNLITWFAIQRDMDTVDAIITICDNI